MNFHQFSKPLHRTPPMFFRVLGSMHSQAQILIENREHAKGSRKHPHAKGGPPQQRRPLKLAKFKIFSANLAPARAPAHTFAR